MNDLSRSQRKKLLQKASIISTAIQCIQNFGYEKTSMELIAKETDIAKGTLYNYFSSKEAIIEAFIQESFKEKLSQRISHFKTLQSTHNRVEFIFTELLCGIEQHKELFEKFLIYTIQKMLSFSNQQNKRLSEAKLTLTSQNKKSI
jgi:AcrR family transcriptional regulator